MNIYLQTEALHLNLTAMEKLHNKFSEEYTIDEIVDERVDADG
eukprot:COSAG03_NODE_4214_length_1635_cov_1.423828_1_plen_42_part_10